MLPCDNNIRMFINANHQRYLNPLTIKLLRVLIIQRDITERYTERYKRCTIYVMR